MVIFNHWLNMTLTMALPLAVAGPVNRRIPQRAWRAGRLTEGESLAQRLRYGNDSMAGEQTGNRPAILDLMP